MYLIDTSAWIQHFSKKVPFNLSQVVPPDDRVMCLPVYQEILQGIREESAYRSIKISLDSAVMVDSPLSADRFLEVAQLYRVARRQGLTVRSSIDCLIAAIALRHDLTVMHHDRDFPNIAKVCSLKQRAV